jgi:hypothetical protein
MKNWIKLLSICILSSYNLFGQDIKEFAEKNITHIQASIKINDSKNRGIPSEINIWQTENLVKSGNSYFLQFIGKTGFTCFGIDWKSNNSNLNPAKFKIVYQAGKNRISGTNLPDFLDWGKPINAEGEYSPLETADSLYWTGLLFVDNEIPCQEILFEISPPEGIEISEIRLDLMDYSSDIDNSHSREVKKSEYKSSCPEIPPIITRDQWCGSYTAYTSASYTPTHIYPTHVVIHHSGSPDSYTDGYALVRSYWNYHLNSLGWSDIGYNYLVDKYGNLFQGRKNGNMPNSDVLGSHVGNANPYAIGICFLGNSDSIVPTNPQIEITNQFLGWWFKNKGFTPGSVANIILQSGGIAYLPRICGHRDVNVNATICPGVTLYPLLSSIITNTQLLVDACGQTGVKTAMDEKWNIFPNPAKNEVFFSTPLGSEKWKIEIYFENGILLNTLTNWDVSNPLNITDLTEGIYLLKISNDQFIKIFKFIKKT